ncbi:MAG: hypothetical protein ACYTGP_09520 [Planctomycetota bacterium]|jgi:hypothetical protein
MRRHRSVVTLLVLILGASPLLGTTQAEEVVRSGEYRFSWFGKDLGREQFTIRKTATGYRIDATLRLDVDGQVPCTSTYELDATRRLVRATYRELTAGGAEVEYEIRDRVLTARGLSGKPRGVVRRYELEDGAVVTGPHYVTDFFVLEPLGLEVGTRRTQTAYTFGFGSWEPLRVTLESRRERDKRLKLPDRSRVQATVYKCEIKAPKKTYKTRSWLDGDGVSARITVGAPIGSMDVRLHANE